jgi:cytosine/adenosine deaminase-related metal-dependent hydrolase
LDLSGAKDRIPPGKDFVGWLREVIRHRRSLLPEQTAKNIEAGIADCIQYGTTLVGDISSQGISWPLLAESPLRSVVFYELLGLPKDRAERTEGEARAWLEKHPATLTCKPGLSPHAPYSVRASLFEAAFRMAQRYELPLATHLAETREELELLEHQRGPFIDFLCELGVWDREGLVHDPHDITRQAPVTPNFLAIHGNYLDIQRAESNTTFVYCPRTHAAFGNPIHPFRDILAKGGRVCLGTDSLASNPDLSVLAEARFVHQNYSNVSCETLLRMITMSGAEALGWEHETGSLAPGKSADLVVLPLPSRDAHDPHSLIFESSTYVEKVMFLGQWVQEK